MSNVLTVELPLGGQVVINTNNQGPVQAKADVGGAGGVTSVFGRTGVVVAQNNDYTSSQIQNLSQAPGSNVTAALNSLFNAAGFQVPNELGAMGATPLFGFALNRYQRGTFSANIVPTLTLPLGYECYLELVQPAVGGPFVVTSWPAVVDWTGGVPPTLSTGANKRDLLRFLCDGTRLRGAVHCIDF